MLQRHLPTFGLAGLVGLTVALLPNPTRPPDVLLGGAICGPEDPLGRAPQSPSDPLASLSQGHYTHDLPQSLGTDWNVPTQTLFNPDTADVQLAVTPKTDGPLTAGQEARVSLTITDRQSGLPVSGRSVAGWMLLQRNAQVAAELPCTAKAQLFTQGRVTARPDVDLNAAKLLVLNREGSIAIVNPQVDFTITQMEGIIPLPGVPADWALATDRQTLFVSLPIFGAVAVIDTRSFQITSLIDLPKGSMPTQLLPLPDGALAVYLAAPGALTIAHPDGTGQSDPVPVGKGTVAMVERFGRMVVAADGRLSVIDTATGQVVVRSDSANGVPSLALAPDGQSVFVATDTAAQIERRDIRALKLRKSIAVDAGVFALALDPAGRQIIALNRATDTLILIDPRTNTILATGRTPPSPVEVTFSHDYAYVRGLGGDHFSVFEMAQMHKGNLSPVDIQSAAAPVTPREALSHARMIAPYGHGALIANQDEAAAYYYMEGMNTPMGTVKTYGPYVQGLMTIDRSFRETAPGVYETTAKLPFGGTYDIPVTVDADGFVQCFSATAKPPVETAIEASRTKLRADPEPLSGLQAGKRADVIVHLTNDKTGKPATGIGDLRLLAFSSSGSWQGRKWANDLGDGRYSVAWTFPKPGRYGLSLQVASAGLEFTDQRPVYFNVEQAGDRALSAKDILP